MKFKFNYLENTLAIHQERDIWHVLSEEQQFISFNKQSFKLSNGWITFTFTKKKIRVLAKIETAAELAYYQKKLLKQCPVTFEFTEADEIKKPNQLKGATT